MYCEIAVLRRCCFCLPLRNGLVVFGILNTLFSLTCLGIYSYSVHSNYRTGMVMLHGHFRNGLDEVAVAIYCAEVVINCLFVYGALKKVLIYVKAFYYYTIVTTILTILLEILECTLGEWGFILGRTSLFFFGLIVELYLLVLVRSLIMKLEVRSPGAYNNPLNPDVPEDEIYNPTTERSAPV